LVATVIIPPSSRAFWSTFTSSLGHDPSDRFYEAFHFCDNAPDADALAALVLAGTKRATTALVWAHDAEDKPIPKPGALSVVTLFSGEPVCIIETVSIEIMPFSEVGAEFAATEGEGDGSLAYWQRVHTEFFGRECERLGREFTPGAPVICERFEVVYRPASGSAVVPPAGE
jgi:uncharacterized protein YhfF